MKAHKVKVVFNITLQDDKEFKQLQIKADTLQDASTVISHITLAKDFNDFMNIISAKSTNEELITSKP